MQLKSAFFLVMISLSLTAPALCQSGLRAQQEQACQDDAYRLCPDEIPDEARVANCLGARKPNSVPHAARCSSNRPANARACPEKVADFFGFDMLQIFDFELRPYQSNESI